MKKLNEVKALPSEYDYYESIKKKSDCLAQKVFVVNHEILKSKLYNLMLDICNPIIYDYTYTFTKEDLFFIIDYGINVGIIIDYCFNDIQIMKNNLKENCIN